MIKIYFKELLEARKINNKSQLAVETKISRNQINNLIGNDNPKYIESGTLEKICRHFNILPKDLLVILNEDGSEWVPEGYKPLSLNKK